MAGKVTSPDLAKLASRVATGEYRPTDAEVRSMAASLVAQAEPADDDPPGPGDVVTVTVSGAGRFTSIERGADPDHPDKPPEPAPEPVPEPPVVVVERG